MKTSIHGQVSQVPFAAAMTVTTDQGLAYSTVLSKEEAARTPGKPNVFRFGAMFPQLAHRRLPDGNGTAGRLLKLAMSMNEGAGVPQRDSAVPAIYTYLGQFIDHEITKTETHGRELALQMECAFLAVQQGQEVLPLQPDEMLRFVNKRVPTFNLDSVLSCAAPRDDRGAMVVGRVTSKDARGDPVATRPQLPALDLPGQEDDHDLPRFEPNSSNEELDRRAQIGDPRNDENVVIAQLHVAFLRAHRRLVHEMGLPAAEADLELQRLFQSIVVTDFLPAVCDRAIVDAVLARPQGVFYRPTRADAFMPLEFSVAAYRFGHSMVRSAYDYNSEFPKGKATLEKLFTFTAFSGDNFGHPRLPQNWIIDWRRWAPDAQGLSRNMAKQVDTLVTGGLMNLPQHRSLIGASDVNVLALRNLARGYLVRLPTGQAVAEAMQAEFGNLVTPLTPPQLQAVAAAADVAAGGNAPVQQLAALKDGQFDEATPLWYYVLAEAAHVRGTSGGRLGPVASAIIADVLVQLIRLTEDNYLDDPGWLPRIDTAACACRRKVTLSDLLRFARVLP